MSIDVILEKIKNGGLPALTGLSFLKSDAEKIKQELDKRTQSKEVEAYYSKCVEVRILQ